MKNLDIKQELIKLLEATIEAEDNIENIDDANEAYIIGQQYAYARALFLIVDGEDVEAFDMEDVYDLLLRAKSTNLEEEGK